MAKNEGRMAYDEDGQPNEDEDETEKSMPTESDLVKAMDTLVDTARGIEGGESVRQQDLAQRMAAGDELTKSEREEMARHLSGEDMTPDFDASTRESWADDPAIAEGWEVSGYLDARDTALAKSLDGIKDALRSSNVENAAVVGRLAKGLHAVGMSNLALRREVTDLHDLVKSLTGQQAARPQPAQGRTSRVGQRFGEQPQNMAKSEGAQGGQGMAGIPQDSASQKAWLNEGLTELIKSTEPGGKNADHGFGQLNGVDLVFEQAKLENYNEVSPQAMKLIADHRGITL